MSRICLNSNNTTETIIWTAGIDVMLLTIYIQECRRNNPINETQIIRIFAEETGHELSWKSLEKRICYLKSLYASLCKSCTWDPRTGVPSMSNEVWTQTTKRHPELSNPNSELLVEFFIQRMTSRLHDSSGFDCFKATLHLPENPNGFSSMLNLAPPHWRDSSGKFAGFSLYQLTENLCSTKKKGT
ncbi:PREDICTED: uncharacterized protein LOC104732845 [Camelina sativa]|uniref:Uncharacterized protein LOC104732845 n=1 Tax=Camelina sativa TaxID=90675 RepID=A0ABM0V4R4_CAMSA|nr:PREDICTED: uncharacterized protein LOC104732845 [Camelina sativa]